MIMMGCCCRAVNQYVIKVNHNKPTQKGFENLIHKAHKGARSIRESKRHDKPFVKTLLGLERGLPLVTFINSDLMIATTEVDFGEDSSPVKLIK
ncbi:hypothetical protein HanIR_Chr14g0711641 [Helianthus annuus]|nr:hypothetical protein HanIR_Chr14g0711641 [Helianthus annuus]